MAEGPNPLTDLSSGSSSQDDSVIRILLLGKKRSEKRSSKNTILGQKKKPKLQKSKKEQETEDDIAEICEEIKSVSEKQVHVIDTPDLLNPNISKEKLESHKEKLLSVCKAGLSAVLLVMPLHEDVENEEETLYFIKHLLGPEVQNYFMVLFTSGAEWNDEDIDEYLQGEDQADLKQLVTECGGKFHSFNKTSAVDDQVPKLLHKIERVMAENGGKWREESRHEAVFLTFTDINNKNLSVIAKLLGKISVTPEERESAIKEAESKGISRRTAVRLAIKASGKLARQKMCNVQ